MIVGVDLVDKVVKVLMAWVRGRIGGGLGIGIGVGLLLVFLPFCFAQPEIVWNSTYVDVQLVGAGGGSLWQTICKDNIPLLEQSICWSPDGGYVEVGAKTQYDYRDSPSDLYVLRSDSEGKPLWQKTYGGALSDESARAVTQSGDGGFILAGYKMPGPLGGWENVYLLKIDEEGNLTWERFYVWDSSGVNRATSIARAEDGFLVVGYTSPSGLQDVYVVRVNSSGGMLWERTYGGNKSEEADFVIQSGDGGFIIVGSTVSFGVPLPGVLPIPGRHNVYILKIDGEGNTVWRVYSGLPQLCWVCSLQSH